MNISGRQIAAARELLKMTQAELAAAAGVGVNTVIRIEKEQTPRKATLQAVTLELERRGIVFTNGERPSVTLDLSRTASPS